MSRRKDESLWRARIDRRTHAARNYGPVDSMSDKVAARLLERGRLAASLLERRVLDQLPADAAERATQPGSWRDLPVGLPVTARGEAR